jgi:hypothetical protein
LGHLGPFEKITGPLRIPYSFLVFFLIFYEF